MKRISCSVMSLLLTLIFYSAVFSQSPPRLNHIFDNKFANGSNGGTMRFSAYAGTRSVPLAHPILENNTSFYTATALSTQNVFYNNQYYGQTFREWITAETMVSTDYTLSYQYNTGYNNDGVININHDAHFNSLHYTAIRSLMNGYGEHTGEQVQINYEGTYSNANTPYNKYVEDGKQLSVTFLNDFWYDNIHFFVNEANPKTLTTNYTDPSNMNLTMTHTGIPDWPSSAPRNLTALHLGSNVNVKITWTEHPNQYVSKYEIWRGCNTPQHPNEMRKLGEVNRGTTYFIDTDFFSDYGGVTSVAATVLYDVRAFYSNESTVTPANWQSFQVYYHDPNLMKQAANNSSEIKEYSIDSYPNPFNPTTTINYQLPQDGMVTIKVYDMLGKEVAILVNEHKSTGYYKVDFDASKLTSGVYICSIQTNNFSKSIKLLLTK